MSIWQKIAICLVGLSMCLVVANAVYTVSSRGLAYESWPGPDVEAHGLPWKTQIIEGSPGHNEYAIWVNVDAPDKFLAAGDELPFDTLTAICNAVVSDRENFMPENSNPDDLDHVDLNLIVGGERLFIHDITIFLHGGACSQSLGFDYVTSRKGKFSTHEIPTETMAVLESWGLYPTGIHFETGTRGRNMEASFELLRSFDRDPEKLNARALCVLALLHLDAEHDLFGITFDPSSYPKLTVKIERSYGSGWVNYTRSYGGAEFEIEDGKCVGIEEYQATEDV